MFDECLAANCVPLLIQQNVDGSDFFNRSWADFKVGFNNSIGNYWLGNDLLSQLTLSGRFKLKFDLQSRSNTSNVYHAEYNNFKVQSEADNYRMQVGLYSGNAGNDAFSYHNGQMFTTYDRDNDLHSSNCAVTLGGRFWYNNCYRCGVNVVSYRSPPWAFVWQNLPGGWDLRSSRMLLQCK